MILDVKGIVDKYFDGSEEEYQSVVTLAEDVERQTRHAVFEHIRLMGEHITNHGIPDDEETDVCGSGEDA